MHSFLFGTPFNWDSHLKQFVPDVPDATSGNVELKTIELNKDFIAEKLGSYIPYKLQEDYKMKALYIDDRLWMSASPSELDDMAALSHYCSPGDNVLVVGLGLGILPTMLQQSGSNVTVLEMNQDVINLVSPYVSSKIEIINCDFWEYVEQGDMDFDIALIDIWESLSSDRIALYIYAIMKAESAGVKKAYSWGLETTMMSIENQYWEDRNDLEECLMSIIEDVDKRVVTYDVLSFVTPEIMHMIDKSIEYFDKNEEEYVCSKCECMADFCDCDDDDDELIAVERVEISELIECGFASLWE